MATAQVPHSELAEIVGVDLDTINNSVRYNIIHRARLGGRQLRARLFSTEEVYKTSYITELVKLGFAPSSASAAVDALWEEWRGAEAPKGWKLYAVVVPTKGTWTVTLCSQRTSGGTALPLLPTYPFVSCPAVPGSCSLAGVKRLPMLARRALDFSQDQDP